MAIYLKNDDLVREIIESKKRNELTPKAVIMFMKIAEESNKKLNYKDPLDREDCISGAIEDLYKYWRRFDPEKSNNAFAYFTQIAKNGFAKVWKKIHHPDAGQMLSLSQEGINI